MRSPEWYRAAHRLAATVVFTLACAWAASALAIGPTPLEAPPTDQLIVKFHDPALGSMATMGAQQVQALSSRAGVTLAHHRPMSGGAQVFKLPRRMRVPDVEAIAARLRADPMIESVEPDRILLPQLLPNDTLYNNQWHLKAPTTDLGAANLPGAWDITTGSSSVVVAVIDSGLVRHADIDSNILDTTGRVVPGYDFISDTFLANDGDGRDSDPSDPGDWATQADVDNPATPCVQVTDSTWHGTHVAGTIGAQGNNGLGVTGIDWAARILPVRVLGKCGGYVSDAIDGIRWAAGLAVTGVPANANPAKVLNMSLGGPGACSLSPTLQSAITDAYNAGAVVVVAAGNGAANLDTTPYVPASCSNVVTVAAVNRSGDRAYYSNYGAAVAIAAPGGEQAFANDPNGVLSTLNSGTTSPVPSPGGDAYQYYQGTSMAAPHVSGIVALMRAANPSLTPSQILATLQSTARAFPGGTNPCTTSTCGAGIIDAAAAVAAASTVTVTATDASASEPGLDTGTFTITRAGLTVAPLTVNFTMSGSAANGIDYVAVSGTATILTGETATTVTITPIDDNVYEGTESVTLTLSASTAYTIGSPASATVTIADDDPPPPPPSGGGGGGCFIATAAFGTPMAAEVRYLRAFRDEYLLTNAPGRWFVDLYYRASPPVAEWLRSHETLRAWVRAGLAPLVAMTRRLVSGEALAAQTPDRP